MTMNEGVSLHADGCVMQTNRTETWLSLKVMLRTGEQGWGTHMELHALVHGVRARLMSKS